MTLTSGANNFNYFPENQLTKFSALLQFKHSEKMKVNFVPHLTSLFLSPPRISVTHSASSGVPLEAPVTNRGFQRHNWYCTVNGNGLYCKCAFSEHLPAAKREIMLMLHSSASRSFSDARTRSAQNISSQSELQLINYV